MSRGERGESYHAGANYVDGGPCGGRASDHPTCNPEDMLILRYPASWWRNMWREALPSGNGVIGASVFGGVKEETVLLNHAQLWHWGHKDELPDVSHVLSRTRTMMDAGRYNEASWLLANALKESGYGTKLASRFPLAAIRLDMPCGSAFRSYRRTLAMDSGEVHVGWTDGSIRYQRRLFVSRADNAVVYEIGSDGQSSVSGEIGLVLHPSDRWADTPEFKELEKSVETGASAWEAASLAGDNEGKHESDWPCGLEGREATEGDAGFAWFAATNDDGLDYGAVMFIKSHGGIVRARNGMLIIEGASSILAVVRVFVKGERGRDWDRLRRELSDLMSDVTYEQLLERHTALHRPLYRSAALELGDEGRADSLSGRRIQEDMSNERLLLDAYEGEAPLSLVRRMWAYGRYLFISGTDASPEAEPFGLYGLWGGDYRLVWSHNMANENVQMMYWHAQVGGLGELTPALFRYYEELMDDFKGNAQKLYGCEGIYIPAGTTPGIGVPNQIVPVILNWTGAAGWLARHFVEHYRFSGDQDFLRGQLIPFLREAVRFYEDFLVTGEDGLYRIYPSVSPENTPLNFMPREGVALAHPMPTTINATMDVAILKELLGNLLAVSRQSGTATRAEHEKWKGMLDKLPAYLVNEDGAVREWIHPDFDDRYAHRHLSHLYPVFPGQEVSGESDPELFEAFKAAVRNRELGAQSGWSLAHMASIYARLGDGESAVECLDILARSSLLPNLFTLHNDWRGMGVSLNMAAAPVQLDANMGWVNAVQEMLLQVAPGFVKLLPALPERWTRGKISGWRFHTGEVAMEWDRERGRFLAVLLAERETELVVKVPEWVGGVQVTGGEFGSSELGRSYLALRLEPGMSARIEMVNTKNG
ncbi:glycoside hydrolase N-terminal domain-containing protein [Paenibacillus sp. MY03]|uniref:glycosyl hydrolase family 95 catalytic domain-containing protein n=1 Tax=Paenibacillus sp. MY03 TaxID=302980 RepID=UPI0026A364AC|nr:glycoside hydrolase N-terminal domain-containing protein [Paenibacillus sp. MY03]